MRLRYSVDPWRVWHMLFASSDLTVKQFCESVGTSVQSFYKWRKRLAEPNVGCDEFTPLIIVSEPAVSFDFRLRLEVKLAKTSLLYAPCIVAPRTGRSSMIGLSHGVEVFICTTPADMRRGFDGLSGMAQSLMERDTLPGHLFVFRNRDRLKILTRIKMVWRSGTNVLNEARFNFLLISSPKTKRRSG